MLSHAVVGLVTAVYGPTEVERCYSVGSDRLDGCRGSSAADTPCVGEYSRWRVADVDGVLLDNYSGSKFLSTERMNAHVDSVRRFHFNSSSRASVLFKRKRQSEFERSGAKRR